jgi:uncharacterized membrane protein
MSVYSNLNDLRRSEMKRSFGKVHLFYLAVILAIPLVFFSHTVLAREYSFITIDVPDAIANWGANGINDSGDIVGTYDKVTKNSNIFIYSGGSFTTIDVYHAWGNGINNSGAIVGQYLDDSNWPHNFLYAGGSFIPIDVPGATSNWGAKGINDYGDIVGSYGDDTGRPGFLYSGGIFTPINVPGAVDGCWTVPMGINNSGAIVGTYNLPDAPGTHRGFLYVGGTFTQIDVPGADGTDVNGINDFGDIVGAYYDAVGGHGFLYSRGIFTTIDVPGAVYGAAYGINNSGRIVGYYVDTIQGRHGFEASPVPEPVSIDIKPGSYPNGINLESRGVVPVAILTTAEFDASTVDPTTVRFAGAPAIKRTMEDVNHDGYLDMLLTFDTQELNVDTDSTEATLTGMTDDGIEIIGTDSVNIVPKGRK